MTRKPAAYLILGFLFFCCLEVGTSLCISIARSRIMPCPDKIEDFGSFDRYLQWQNHLDDLGLSIYYGNAEYSAYTALWNKPNVVKKFSNIDVRFNSRGFRSEEFQVPKPENVRRIFLIGASTVQGGVNDKWTISHYLKEDLDRFLPGTEVINAGVIGYSSDNEFMLIKTKILELDPDLIIVLDGALDLTSPRELRSFPYDKLQENIDGLINHPTFFSLASYAVKLAARKSSLLMFFHRKMGRRQLKHSFPRFTIAQKNIDHYSTNLKIMKSLLEARNVAGMLCFQPIFGYAKRRLSPFELEIADYLKNTGHAAWTPEIARTWPKVGGLVSRIPSSKFVKVYDLSKVFADEKEATFGDSAHYSPKGDQIIADALARIIKRDFLRTLCR